MGAMMTLKKVIMIEFPDPEKADANGLLATGGDLAPETLIAAYRKGIFPWYEAGGPILWWSPDPRMVLFPDDFHCSRRLARRIRQGRFRISENTAFDDVMRACTTREEGSWITPGMIAAYTRLFELGHARSVEVWEGDTLAGGLYGINIGRAFFAESMFHTRTDTSKMAVAYLVEKAQQNGWIFIDCQFYTEHLASLGAIEIPRNEFLHLLDRALT
ncbi:MAG: leucyl/phenylalanyl-tRNA--protein transferase [Zetaproteobacteria bacterium]|nr:MAG: leucyl/phenylalanyl-tRNA--protein transferase [Zetaproteobacteria bacterium]